MLNPNNTIDCNPDSLSFSVSASNNIRHLIEQCSKQF